MISIPTLETDRLILRAPHADDLPRLTAFYATERSHMVGGPRDELETWDALAKRLGHWAIHGFGLWHLTERASGAFAGWTGMEEVEGKGLAYEAVLSARAYAARHQGLNGVMSYIAHANDRSRALATRLGAAYEDEGELLGKRCQIWRHPRVEEQA